MYFDFFYQMSSGMCLFFREDFLHEKDFAARILLAFQYILKHMAMEVTKQGQTLSQTMMWEQKLVRNVFKLSILILTV